MCGISTSITLRRGVAAANGQIGPGQGQPTPEGEATTALQTQLGKSLDVIAHRGPDSRGIWISEDSQIGLAHCRLSINDLSPQGDQPIHSDDGNIQAVVCGEIYEYDRLREVLARDHGYVFQGHSDSELVVALYKAHGAPGFLDHLRGEFAFVLYDRLSDRIIAARDRFGIKPLFWTLTGQASADPGKESPETGSVGQRLLIASEVKAFLPLDWKPRWDVKSITDGAWLHDTNTLFQGVAKVLPGHWMEITSDGRIQQHQYWDADYKDKREVEQRTMEEMIQGVRERLVEAIRLRLRADVPIGIYLSGGIDSSLVAGIVTRLVREEGVKLGDQDATSRICCFTIQFPEDSGMDESGKSQ